MVCFQHCNEGDPPCPSIFVERLCFEMDKHYTETKLQLMLSPAVIYIRDSYQVDIDISFISENYRILLIMVYMIFCILLYESVVFSIVHYHTVTCRMVT